MCEVFANAVRDTNKAVGTELTGAGIFYVIQRRLSEKVTFKKKHIKLGIKPWKYLVKFQRERKETLSEETQGVVGSRVH